MASVVYKNGDNTPSNVVEIVTDLVSDIATLDTSYGSGSTCLVIEDSSVYMLGPDKVWHEL